MIVSILGSPSEQEIADLDNAQARQFMKQLPHTERCALSKLYPQSNPLAIDLLEKMLQFDPSKRCTVEQVCSFLSVWNLESRFE
jgi:hypothetical protein